MCALILLKKRLSSGSQGYMEEILPSLQVSWLSVQCPGSPYHSRLLLSLGGVNMLVLTCFHGNLRFWEECFGLSTDHKRQITPVFCAHQAVRQEFCLIAMLFKEHFSFSDESTKYVCLDLA